MTPDYHGQASSFAGKVGRREGLKHVLDLVDRIRLKVLDTVKH